MKGPMIFSDMVRDRIFDDYRRIFQIPLGNSKMDDDRRTIHEEDNLDAQSSTQAFLVKAGGLPLGNHYHAKKTEIFFVIEGSVERLITASDGGTGPTEEFSLLQAGTMIVMPPGVAHTFFLSPGSKMICYATERFNQADMVAVKLA